MYKYFFILVIIVSGLYVLLCILLFFIQEKLIFYPSQISKSYNFHFNNPFEEVFLKTKEDIAIHGLHFKSNTPKGVILYLHGNAGALNSWGEVAQVYTKLMYDVFIIDYRGYGKSDGKIKSQKQFFQDVQLAYDYLKGKYKENNMVVLGYSIGSGAAAWVASQNNPKLLILQAPYYSLPDLIKSYNRFIPAFVLKYKFETNNYIRDCKMPVIIFHGDLDEVIYYGSSVKLKKIFKEQDTLITLKGVHHNGITYEPQYLSALSRVLH